MNKSRSLWLVFGVVSVLAIAMAGYVGAAGGKGYGAKETAIIKVYGTFDTESVTRIEPDLLWVGRASTVIWTNMSQADIKIIFRKGEECKKATAATLNWGLGEQACYITQQDIPPGGTTSALFKDIGRYDYEIVFVGKDVTQKGAIEVRTEPGT
jgi:hypothetical protein